VLRTRIEGQLARLGDQNAITRLANRARGVTDEGCPRPQDDERIDALNALAQMDAEQALPNLRRVLARRDACTQQMRRTAVWLVASRVKPVDAAPILMSVAKTDPDREVREQAVFWMSNVPTEEATGMLIELAKKSEDIDMQKRAVYALSRSKSPRAATTLREIALDASAEVELRSDAVRYFLTGPARTSDDAMPFLKDVYGRADDSRFKESLLSIIGSRRNEDSRNFLVEIAQNSRESMETRRIAIWSLQSSGVTGAQLAVIYDRGTEVELRKQVISVLGNLKDNGGVDKLIDIARNDKNSELKKQAISSLQRTKDPRAVALLQEIINR
jgi:HEAT repeat protein